jgi:AcrR family transcriptional regulator
MATRQRVRQEHRLLTKRRMLGAALEVFAERGYNAATVEDIVAAAGVARATFYLHFKNKMEIVECLTEEVHPGVLALYNDLDDLIAANPARVRQAIRPWISQALGWFDENRTVVLLWQEISVSEPEFHISPAISVAEGMPRYLAQWPEELREIARLRIVLLIQLLTRAFLLSRVRHALPAEDEILVDVIADLWAAGLRQPP